MAKVSMKSQVIDEVKMEWQKSSFITSAKGTVFVVAAQNYNSDVALADDGTIAVFFNCGAAFLFGGSDDEGDYLYTVPDLKHFLKENTTAGFPTDYDSMLTLILYKDGEYTVNQELIDKWHLGEYVEDMKNRINDLQFTGVEYNPEDLE